MKKRIRIKDIADKAGVSTGTVDRVLHNRGKVAPVVKQRVQAVIEELGYEKNRLASALAYNKTTRIAVLLPNPDRDPFWQQTHSGMLKAAQTVQHYGLVLDFYHFDFLEASSFTTTAEEVLTNRPNGLIFAPLFAKESKLLLKDCQMMALPNVMINTFLENEQSISYIGQDSYQSGILGGRLLNFGLLPNQATCILNLDYHTKNAQHLLDKERGFRDYFKSTEAKVEIIRADFEDFENEQYLTAFLEDFLEQHPNLHGIFITNSRANKVVTCLEKFSNRTLKIVGYDLIASNLHYLRNNKIDFLLNQNPVAQGFQGVLNIFKHLILQEKVPQKQYLPLDIVVKENVDYYLSKPLDATHIV